MSVALWCVCGGSISGSSDKAKAEAVVDRSFRRVHKGNGHEITANPGTGRRWQRIAERQARQGVR